jgi:hypothetical protein
VDRINTTNHQFSGTFTAEVKSEEVRALNTKGRDSLDRRRDAINREATETHAIGAIELANRVVRRKTLRFVV